MIEYIDKRIEQFEVSGNRGYRAKSNISQYTIILIERPYKIYKSLDKMISNIETDIKRYKLIDKFNELYPRELDKQDKKYYIEKICKNAFNFNRKTHSSPCILFSGAIFNHSCNPNILFINIKNNMIFYTVTDINKDDELYDHYIDVNQDHKKRTELLLDNYGFICKCVKCVNKIDDKKINYYKHHNKIINNY